MKRDYVLLIQVAVSSKLGKLTMTIHAPVNSRKKAKEIAAIARSAFDGESIGFMELRSADGKISYEKWVTDKNGKVTEKK